MEIRGYLGELLAAQKELGSQGGAGGGGLLSVWVMARGHPVLINQESAPGTLWHRSTANHVLILVYHSTNFSAPASLEWQ